MRTLLFLSDLDGGGAQRTFVNLANALPRDRIAPTLVVGRDAGPARRWLNADTSLKNLERTRLRRYYLAVASVHTSGSISGLTFNYRRRQCGRLAGYQSSANTAYPS